MAKEKSREEVCTGVMCSLVIFIALMALINVCFDMFETTRQFWLATVIGAPILLVLAKVLGFYPFNRQKEVKK